MGTPAVILHQGFYAVVVFFHRLMAFFQQRQSLHHARFAALHQLTGLTTTRLDESSLLLGVAHYNQLLRVRPTRQRRELGNLLIVAPTRGGKGLLATSQLLTWKHSVIVNDISSQYASLLGAAKGKRVRPSEEMEKGHNPYFLKHTIAVTDVLIAAKLISETVPAIRLPRLYTERELKRKIYVTLSDKPVCLEPDAGVLFRMTETWHDPPETWEDFFHIEVYRTHLRQERFKQKIRIYAAYAASPQHSALFHTPALAIAIICATDQLAGTLKHWTEQVLQQVQQPDLNDRYCSKYSSRT